MDDPTLRIVDWSFSTMIRIHVEIFPTCDPFRFAIRPTFLLLKCFCANILDPKSQYFNITIDCDKFSEPFYKKILTFCLTIISQYFEFFSIKVVNFEILQSLMLNWKLKLQNYKIIEFFPQKLMIKLNASFFFPITTVKRAIAQRVSLSYFVWTVHYRWKCGRSSCLIHVFHEKWRWVHRDVVYKMKWIVFDSYWRVSIDFRKKIPLLWIESKNTINQANLLHDLTSFSI